MYQEKEKEEEDENNCESHENLYRIKMAHLKQYAVEWMGNRYMSS